MTRPRILSEQPCEEQINTVVLLSDLAQKLLQSQLVRLLMLIRQLSGSCTVKMFYPSRDEMCTNMKPNEGRKEAEQGSSGNGRVPWPTTTAVEGSRSIAGVFPQRWGAFWFLKDINNKKAAEHII